MVKGSLSKSKEYFYGLGRRKSSSARVRVLPNKKDLVVNDRGAEEYFKPRSLVKKVLLPVEQVGLTGKVGLSIKVKGGGMHSQAEAAQLGVARALVLLNPDFRTTLKTLGFLTRDPRIKERKKYGLKRARRAPQWSKR